MPSQNPIMSDRVIRDPHPDRCNDKSSKKRAVSTEMNPRQTGKRDDGERQHASRYIRGRSASDDRRGQRRRGGRNRPSKSPDQRAVMKPEPEIELNEPCVTDHLILPSHSQQSHSQHCPTIRSMGKEYQPRKTGESRVTVRVRPSLTEGQGHC